MGAVCSMLLQLWPMAVQFQQSSLAGNIFGGFAGHAAMHGNNFRLVSMMLRLHVAAQLRNDCAAATANITGCATLRMPAPRVHSHRHDQFDPMHSVCAQILELLTLQSLLPSIVMMVSSERSRHVGP